MNRNELPSGIRWLLIFMAILGVFPLFFLLGMSV